MAINNITGFAFVHHLRDGSHSSGDYRGSAGHGLDHGKSERLLEVDLVKERHGASQKAVSFIVIGRSHKGPLEQLYSRSDITELTRRTAVPILVFKHMADDKIVPEKLFERPLFATNWSETSAKAVGQSITSAHELAKVLRDKLIKGTFEPLLRKQNTIPGAAELIDELAQAFRQDEINMELSSRIKDLAVAAQALQSEPPTPKAADNILVEERIEVKTDTLEKSLDELASTLRKKIADVDDPKIEVHITVTGRKRS